MRFIYLYCGFVFRVLRTGRNFPLAFPSVDDAFPPTFEFELTADGTTAFDVADDVTTFRSLGSFATFDEFPPPFELLLALPVDDDDAVLFTFDC